MRKTIITIADYPITLTFSTTEKLPKFKYGCEVRTKIAQNRLSKVHYDAPHMPSDFDVEAIDKIADDEEVWHLGS